jgi:hypothetical protein
LALESTCVLGGEVIRSRSGSAAGDEAEADYSRRHVHEGGQVAAGQWQGINRRLFERHLVAGFSRIENWRSFRGDRNGYVRRGDREIDGNIQRLVGFQRQIATLAFAKPGRLRFQLVLPRGQAQEPVAAGGIRDGAGLHAGVCIGEAQVRAV